MLFILFLAAQLATQATSGLPEFEQFKVSEIFKGTPAQPRLKTAGQRRFRTMIRDGAKKGSNFAGHYAIAEWGCGSGCVSIAVIDVQSGAVYDGPFGALVNALVDASRIEGPELTYHLDSRLFVAQGCPNEKNCGTYYYEWTGSSFKLLRKIAIKGAK